MLTGAAAAVALAVASLLSPAVASAAVADKHGDNPAGTVDINVADVSPSCATYFIVTVLPQNALKLVEPKSGALPAIELDQDGNGRVDRLVGQPKGKTAGVFAVARGRLGKRIGSARREVDSGQGYFVRWHVKSGLVVKRKRIRWRAISRSAVSGPVDRAPNKGFAVTRFSAIC